MAEPTAPAASRGSVSLFDPWRHRLALLTSASTLVLIFIGGKVQFDRRNADHLEIGAALGATNQIPFVDIVLVDLDLGVTFRTGRHMPSSQGPRDRNLLTKRRLSSANGTEKISVRIIART